MFLTTIKAIAVANGCRVSLKKTGEVAVHGEPGRVDEVRRALDDTNVHTRLVSRSLIVSETRDTGRRDCRVCGGDGYTDDSAARRQQGDEGARCPGCEGEGTESVTRSDDLSPVRLTVGDVRLIRAGARRLRAQAHEGGRIDDVNALDDLLRTMGAA